MSVMASVRAGQATRWAGVPAARRRDERRELLVQVAFELFGAGGEQALSVRAVCRGAGLHTRYFYENFTGTSELLAAVYDQQAVALREYSTAGRTEAGTAPEAVLRSTIRSVLRFISEDPRRGRVLFGDGAGAGPLAARRRAWQTALLEDLIRGSRASGAAEPGLPVVVAATMFAGAMSELAQQWASGRLGDDLDAVVDNAVELSLALQAASRRPSRPGTPARPAPD